MRISVWSSAVCSSDLDEIARAEFVAAAALMRDHLCEGPIEIAGVRADDLDGVVAGLAHGGGRQMRFQPDRQTAIRLIVSVDQIRSEERRVGKECVRTCRSRWSPDH